MGRFNREGYISKEEIPPLELDKCLAKTKYVHGRRVKGQNVLEHCILSGLVAQVLIQRIPEAIFTFPSNAIGFVVALHDIGKLNPGFQAKIYRSLGESNVLSGISNLVDKDREWKYHFSVGRNWLFHRMLNKGISEKLAYIIGAHHGGKFYVEEFISDYGGPGWSAVREEFISKLEKYFDISAKEVFSLALSQEELYLLAGITCVSDWIASCEGLAHITKTDFYGGKKINLINKINVLLDEAGLFFDIPVKPGLSFSKIFGFEPNLFQYQSIEGLTFDSGMYIVEAPMGSGKTELALYIAYKILEKGFARGIYFALPTKITSESMYDRFLEFVKKVVSRNISQVNLIHSMSWMFFEFGSDASSSGPWASSNRKAILAPFAVGTVDQVLLAVINAYFFFVRLFGILGKIIILDEIHSYDVYTSTILQELMEQSLDYKSTLIILSATLSDLAKQRLLGNIISKFKLPVSWIVEKQGYPQISSLSLCSPPTVITSSAELQRTVKTSLIYDDMSAVSEALEVAKIGAQVIWIENTVKDAQEMFKVLRARAEGENVEVGLLHSRFVRVDRKNKERYWIDILGKNGIEKRLQKGRILVGTQVLEQSLDIDGDFMVSRIAPLDMLLQRVGRLWRHKKFDNIRPIKDSRFWILSPEYSKIYTGEKHFGSFESFYHTYYLYRTLELLSKISVIVLPRDIRPLLNEIYSFRDEKNKLWIEKLNEVELLRRQLERSARISVSRNIATPLPDEEYTTRNINKKFEKVDVLLVKEYDKEKNRFRLYNDTVLDLSLPLRGRDKRKAYANIIENSVPVPRIELLSPCNDAVLSLFSDVIEVNKGEYLGGSERVFSVAFYKKENAPLMDFDGITNLGAIYSSRVGYKLM